MTNNTENTADLKIYGDAASPTLIYLPGLHGDWTLISSFRRALNNRTRFVEVTYPRTLTWSLEDYAAGVEASFLAAGINSGWLLAESFGSQIAWHLATRNRFATQGIILAGGFGKHPFRFAVRVLEKIAGQVPLRVIVAVLFGYARLTRLRYRRSPETLARIDEFIARRTELDRQAACRRLQLVAANDPCSAVRQIKVPVFALTGSIDPVVPWFVVRPWLKEHCTTLRDYKVIWRADHNVLRTAANQSAELVVNWMNSTPEPQKEAS